MPFPSSCASDEKVVRHAVFEVSRTFTEVAADHIFYYYHAIKATPNGVVTFAVRRVDVSKNEGGANPGVPVLDKDNFATAEGQGHIEKNVAEHPRETLLPLDDAAIRSKLGFREPFPEQLLKCLRSMNHSPIEWNEVVIYTYPSWFVTTSRRLTAEVKDDGTRVFLVAVNEFLGPTPGESLPTTCTCHDYENAGAVINLAPVNAPFI
jgi:hypothetical protein